MSSGFVTWDGEPVTWDGFPATWGPMDHFETAGPNRAWADVLSRGKVFRVSTNTMRLEDPSKPVRKAQ